MTDTAIIALLAAVPATITSLGALIAVLRQGGKIQEVKQIVDGPLSVALKSNAELTQRVAEMSGTRVDALAATNAAALQQNRVEGQQAAPMKSASKMG